MSIPAPNIPGIDPLDDDLDELDSKNTQGNVRKFFFP
jgi:hypothetical protein